MSKPTILITGCSQGGIGDALARQFAKRGHHVFAAVRNLGKAPAQTANIQAVELDVTSSESIGRLASYLAETLPDSKLDILINNAAFAAAGPLIEADLGVAKQLYDTNVIGLLAVTQAFASMLIAAKGKIVNISSIGGILPIPWAGLYSSSKAAVTIMSETLRLELAPFGVTVVTGMLGRIQSNIYHNDTWKGLPESSRYQSVEPQMAKGADGNIGPKPEDAHEFAQRFVSDILGGASGQIWRGAKAQTVRAVGYHAPAAILDRMLVSGCGLDAMAVEKS